MKTSGISIQIPNPCHESWQGMSPTAQGRFCGSCSKTVIDFTGKSDVEIRDLLLEQAGQKVCGHFKTTQLNRSLQVNPLSGPRPLVSARTFAIALVFVFGTSLVSCYDHQGKKMEDLSVNFFLPASYKNEVLGEPAISGNTPEDTVALKTIAPVIPEEISDPVMRGDVVLLEEIQGKIEYVPEPTDTLEQIKNPDSTIGEGLVITMGTVMIANPGEDILKQKDSVSAEEDRIKGITNEINSPVLQVYPNPSSGEFTIAYTLSKPADVSLLIFDQAGSLVRELINIRSQHSGNYRIPVTLSDKPAGMYIAVCTVNGKQSSAKLVVAR